MSTLEKLRSVRIFNIALFDIVAGIIGLVLIAMTGILGKTIKKHALLFGVLGVFPIGELFHLLFRVNTPVLGAVGVKFKNN